MIKLPEKYMQMERNGMFINVWFVNAKYVSLLTFDLN